MTLKTKFARQIGKLSAFTLQKFTNGGSSFPGKIALKFDPEILHNLSENYDVAIITGTNGKTLTTSLATNALRQKYSNVLTNDSGSNMVQGITSSFITAPSLPKGERGIAILEVDEGSLKNIVPYVHPKVFVHTNLFEDQLDRYGSLEAVYDKLIEAALLAPEATIITNADCPILQTKDIPNPKIYFGFNSNCNHLDTENHTFSDYKCPNCQENLKYNMRTYGDLGDYYCEKSFFKRPQLNYEVQSIEDMNLNYSTFTINEHSFTLPVAGIYNIYNALAAYSLATYFNVSEDLIAKSFGQTERIFGRQEELNINDHHVLLNLVKNPVGFNQVVNILSMDQDDSILIALFNNNYADGTDPSWINDADFERFISMPIKKVYIAGSVSDELSQRFIQAGFTSEKIQKVDSFEEILDIIELTEIKNIHILASYTATLAFRKLLSDRKLL